MSKKPTAYTPPLPYGTNLMDRMNVAIHLRRHLKMFARRWYVFVFCTLVGLGIYAYKANEMPNIYRATSRLSLTGKFETRASFTTEAEYQEALDTYYQDQIIHMLGRSVLKKVEDKMRQDYPNPPGGAAPQVTINAVRQPGSSTWQMIVDSTDFKYAQRYAQHWAEAFIESKEERKDFTKSKQAAFTAREILNLTEELKKVRADMQLFRKEKNIGSAKDTGGAAQEHLNTLNDKLLGIQAQLKQLENMSPEKIADTLADNTAAGSSPNTAAAPRASRVEADPMEKFSDSEYPRLKLLLMTKESELKARSETLLPEHPVMASLQEEIKQYRQGLTNQLEIIQQRRAAEIDRLRNNAEALKPIIADQLKIVIESASIQHEYKRLEDDETRIQEALAGHQKTLQAIESTTSSEEQIFIDEAGIGSPLPVGPNRLRLLLTGLFLGMAVGIGLICFLHRMDDRLDLAEDVESSLEEPVLGQIPLVNRRQVKDGRLLVTQMDQHNMFAESIRSVRSAVLFGANRGRTQVILVTSAVPGDGKTTFTVNFALTLASAGHRVLLVDADLRRGNTFSYFSHERNPGLREVLAGELHWKDVVNEGPVPTLSLIHTGQLPENPGELLLSPVMAQFIQQARQEFDSIIVDCPPLTAIDDTFSLVPAADAILFVVRAGQTSMRFARNALAAIRQRGAKVMGIVLNGITVDNPSYYYASYYHSYYTKTTRLNGEPRTVSRPAEKMASPRSNGHPSFASGTGLESAPDSSPVEEEQSRADGDPARRALAKRYDDQG